MAGHRLVHVGTRCNRHGQRLLLRAVDEDKVWSVPVRWTDVAPPSEELMIGNGRSVYRVSDLLILQRMVSEMRGQPGVGGPDLV